MFHDISRYFQLDFKEAKTIAYAVPTPIARAFIVPGRADLPSSTHELLTLPHNTLEPIYWFLFQIEYTRNDRYIDTLIEHYLLMKLLTFNTLNLILLRKIGTAMRSARADYRLLGCSPQGSTSHRRHRSMKIINDRVVSFREIARERLRKRLPCVKRAPGTGAACINDGQ